MEWLQTILDELSPSENGKVDSTQAQKRIQAELAKHFIPKETFNTKNDELKEANKTIKALQDSNADNETLQQQIADYKQSIEQLTREKDTMVKTSAIEKALADEGCTDVAYAIYKQGGVEKFYFAQDGNPIGISEVAATLKEAHPAIFKTQIQAHYDPKRGTDPNGSNPFAKDSFNLTEQGQLLRQQPEQAKALAKAAGVAL